VQAEPVVADPHPGQLATDARAASEAGDLAIPGVQFLALEVYADERGSVAEVFRQEWFAGLPDFVQGNIGRSRAGVLRGMHFHQRQADLWVPISGEATAAVFDLRDGSPAARTGATFDAVAGMAVYIPPGVAHGFCARSDFTLLYLVDRTYDDGADEHGFSPLDPTAGIEWPVADPVLSARDRDAPSLEDALARTPVEPWAP
jgi:dTDP-4-dehydrorhamnose 3,5-epimerase